MTSGPTEGPVLPGGIAPTSEGSPLPEGELSKVRIATIILMVFLGLLGVSLATRSGGSLFGGGSGLVVEIGECQWKMDVAEGMILPYVQYTVRNTGSTDIRTGRVRIDFIKKKDGTITNSATELISDLPKGKARGPIISTSTVGYQKFPSEAALKEAIRSWRIEVFAKDDIFSPEWQKVTEMDVAAQIK